MEIGCPITCGDCKALLLMKKFVCPGINVKCVKVGSAPQSSGAIPPQSINGLFWVFFLLSDHQYEDQLISPKQFVHISGKATLKDWKRAIRMGGVMLRSAANQNTKKR